LSLQFQSVEKKKMKRNYFSNFSDDGITHSQQQSTNEPKHHSNNWLVFARFTTPPKTYSPFLYTTAVCPLRDVALWFSLKRVHVNVPYFHQKKNSYQKEADECRVLILLRWSNLITKIKFI
jgi:hypothetical protein